jgi:Xaa-Pro aminopeptidase
MLPRERADLFQTLMRKEHLDLLLCALPMHVLMLSGYWPVVGTGVVAAFADGGVNLLVPEDEAGLALFGWADDIRTFSPSSLQTVETAAESIRWPLVQLVGSAARRIGFESGAFSAPSSYAAMHLYGGSVATLLAQCFPKAACIPADKILAELCACKTPSEITRIRTACEIARAAFEQGAFSIVGGATEIEVAGAFRRGLSEGSLTVPGVQRADGVAWCMSGPNSALASGAYARSGARRIANGDLVLIHCNSYIDGYWTDITRTFCAGEPDERQLEIFDAVWEARQAALDAIAPGIQASAVDRAARDVMKRRGFGDAFVHSTGHGVGFHAISAGAQPRLHPASTDTLEPGMVFNVEPAAYFPGCGGVRHCDVVAVNQSGYELLTPFQSARAVRPSRVGG